MVFGSRKEKGNFPYYAYTSASDFRFWVKEPFKFLIEKIQTVDGKEILKMLKFGEKFIFQEI